MKFLVLKHSLVVSFLFLLGFRVQENYAQSASEQNCSGTSNFSLLMQNPDLFKECMLGGYLDIKPEEPEEPAQPLDETNSPPAALPSIAQSAQGVCEGCTAEERRALRLKMTVKGNAYQSCMFRPVVLRGNMSGERIQKKYFIRWKKVFSRADNFLGKYSIIDASSSFSNYWDIFNAYKGYLEWSDDDYSDDESMWLGVTNSLSVRESSLYYHKVMRFNLVVLGIIKNELYESDQDSLGGFDKNELISSVNNIFDYGVDALCLSTHHFNKVIRGKEVKKVVSSEFDFIFNKVRGKLESPDMTINGKIDLLVTVIKKIKFLTQKTKAESICYGKPCREVLSVTFHRRGWLSSR